MYVVFEMLYCCRKTAVRDEDQLLDFSVPELVRRQSVFGSPSELRKFHVVQFSKSTSRRMFCSNGFDIMHVVCIGLLSAEFSAVNTGLGRPMFWKPLCLLITPEGLATTNYQLA